jgi:hypothetical protein
MSLYAPHPHESPQLASSQVYGQVAPQVPLHES